MKWASRHSLRTHLVLWNTVTLALLFGVLGLALRYTVVARVMASVDHELDAKSQPLLHGPPLGGMPPPPGRWLPPGIWPPPDHWSSPPQGWPPRRFPGTDNPYIPRLFDLNGARAGRHGGGGLWDRTLFDASRRGHTLYATVRRKGIWMRVLSRPTPLSGPVRGVVQVAYPLTDVDKAIREVGQTLLALIPVALLCAGGAGAYLTDRVLRRVRLLTRSAGRISANDPSARLPVAGEDEFSELAETFNALLGRLEGAIRYQQELVARQRRFTADASHELKTPLTVIQGSASLALSGPAAGAETMESLREIHQAAGTMSRLVQDMLMLARSDDGKLGRERVALPVWEVLARAAAQVPPGGAAIALPVADESLQIEGNSDELLRLFSNLLVNAQRHTPADGLITVTAAQTGGQVAVTVSDTGTGISPEHLPHLGERFYRVDGARARQDGGTGLGLAISQSIAEAHGGQLSITSVLGQGTIVTVIFPASVPVPENDHPRPKLSKMDSTEKAAPQITSSDAP